MTIAVQYRWRRGVRLIRSSSSSSPGHLHVGVGLISPISRAHSTAFVDIVLSLDFPLGLRMFFHTQNKLLLQAKCQTSKDPPRIITMGREIYIKEVLFSSIGKVYGDA